MRKKIFYFILLFSSISFSQKNVIIIDTYYKKPIPYANIKILNKDKGFHSDAKGVFQMVNNLNLKDTLFISSLGFYPKKIIISDINDTISLIPKVETLNEITIKAKKPKFKKIGFKKKNMTFFTGTDLQLALFLKPKKEDYESSIDKIIIPLKKNGSHRKINKESKEFNSILKISFFSMKNNLPNKSLTNSPIIINYNHNSENSVTIDLSNEYIIFDKNGVFICFEIVGEIDEKGVVIDKLNHRPGFIYTNKNTKDFNDYKTYYKTKFNDKWIKLDKKTFHFEKDIFPAIKLVLAKYEN